MNRRNGGGRETALTVNVPQTMPYVGILCYFIEFLHYLTLQAKKLCQKSRRNCPGSQSCKTAEHETGFEFRAVWFQVPCSLYCTKEQLKGIAPHLEAVPTYNRTSIFSLCSGLSPPLEQCLIVQLDNVWNQNDQCEQMGYNAQQLLEISGFTDWLAAWMERGEKQGIINTLPILKIHVSFISFKIKLIFKKELSGIVNNLVEPVRFRQLFVILA